MKYSHHMPFGAEVGAGGTRFRLWAPSSPRMTLELGRDLARPIEMQPAGDGWHEAFVEGVGAGAAYAFRIQDGASMPDPASRANPWDVGGPSMVIDARRYDWTDGAWRGRPWHEAVVYEMHVGSFTGEGTFRAAIQKLDYLSGLGITAIEVMPVADFAGTRNWGYDGVLPFAPDSAYGFPDDFKAFVEAAHARGLMVLLDVVYNHFGPEGNYLGAYAKDFFNDAHQTPWGAAINFDGERSRTVRDFFVHNALFWIEEYRLDGLRLDAVHAIADDSPVHIVEEIANAIANGPGRDRHVHLVLENDANSARLLEIGHPPTRVRQTLVTSGAAGRQTLVTPGAAGRQTLVTPGAAGRQTLVTPGAAGAATDGCPISLSQWNDDAHHAFHVLLTGERDGYYGDYANDPARLLARSLAEGFAWQGEPSAHRGGAKRGEPSAHLPLTAFMPFLQNHDQVGNRAMGDRLATLVPPERLRLAMAMLLLAPSVPLLFMGEEFAATTPFLYFCDFDGELARAVRDGRRREFASFARFAEEEAREAIPDPGDPETFARSRLDWTCLTAEPHAAALEHFKRLLALRATAIVPRLSGDGAHGRCKSAAPGFVAIDWTLGDGSRLGLRANLADAPVPSTAAPGELIHSEGGRATASSLPAWSAVWSLAGPEAAKRGAGPEAAKRGAGPEAAKRGAPGQAG